VSELELLIVKVLPRRRGERLRLVLVKWREGWHRFAVWWTHDVLHYVEIGSALSVLSVDTFGVLDDPHHTYASIHHFAASGCMVMIGAHTWQRWREKRIAKWREGRAE
jgi:hypothetical protein